MDKKVYLGDSVYARFDGYHIILTTENGSDLPSNEIALEPSVYQKFLKYVKSINATYQENP